MRVWTLHIRVCSVYAVICVRVSRCERICVLAWWKPTFQLLVFSLLAVAALLLLLPNNGVCITPSLKLSSSVLCGSHGTSAVTQQVCVDHYEHLRCVC